MAAELPSPRLIKVHVQCLIWGVMISVASLAVGGIYQGLKLNDAGVAFAEVTQTMLVFYRLSTLGELLLLVGNVALAGNCAWLFGRWCCAVCCPVWKQWTTVAPGTAPAEAKA
jgi:cbb3-type cytochrome oxidase subunit 1